MICFDNLLLCSAPKVQDIKYLSQPVNIRPNPHLYGMFERKEVRPVISDAFPD